MTAIRVVYDGKAFIPQQPISLPAQSEALVLVDGEDAEAQQQLNDAIRAYYAGRSDVEDEEWGKATAPKSHRAWDED